MSYRVIEDRKGFHSPVCVERSLSLKGAEDRITGAIVQVVSVCVLRSSGLVGMCGAG